MSGVGLYGKVPAQGDFVRVNILDPAAQAFVQWLEECNEVLHASRAVMPPDPTFFYYRGQGARTALLGVIGPSSDSVGRNFPMALFTTVDVATFALKFPMLPVAYSHFLADAAQLVAQAAGMTSAQLSERVRAMGPLVPGPVDFSAADNVCRDILGGASAQELERRLFGEAQAGRQYYAFRTFLSACEAVRGREPAKTNVTLDCPLGGDVDLFAWLELARRALRWQSGPPPFLWTEGGTPRLLIPLGPAPSASLSYVARPDHAGSKLWPLLSDRPEAIESARQALGPQKLWAVDEPSANLETLLATLSA